MIRPSAPLAALVTLAGCTAADSAGPSLSTSDPAAGPGDREHVTAD